jgi:restriction endonuclease S subunit
MKEDGINWETVPHIPLAVHEQLPKSKVYPNDVLYSMAGTIGLAVVAPEDLGECNSNQATAKIRLKDKTINPHYLAAFLNTRLGRYQSERIANGQTVLNINLGEIGNLQIPIFRYL